MKKKKYLYLTAVIAVFMLIGVTMALIPPPPANQDLGIYDTMYGNFVEDECRGCHDSGVPNTHHLLVQSEGFECQDCHTVGPSGGVIAIRDCLECHLASPHHQTDEALDRHCSHCHGSFVDDYDDGHYIPTYNTTLVTPDTEFRVENETTGKKWGGCEACHEANTTPVQGASIDDNYETHHNIWPGDNSKCDICHNMTSSIPIRQCEDCHGVKSLHNIQYEYSTTNGLLGYGHIGDNWDCMGCHAWFDASSIAPQTGPIIPTVDKVSPSALVSGEETVLTITGTNFRNTVNNIDYTSDVTIIAGDKTITVAPDSITDSEMIVTIPSLDDGSCALYVVKSDMKSKLSPLVVVPPVTIDSATIEGTNVVITGSGFSVEPGEEYYDWLGVTINHGDQVLNFNIESWTDTMIEVSCPDAAVGDTVSVNALLGSDSIDISDASDITINLHAGWNLISVPLRLTTWELGDESIVGNPLDVTPQNSLISINRYNTVSGLFEKCDYFNDWGWSPATGSKEFTRLEPGRGYWVNANQDCVLRFTGTGPTDLDITLNKGWNLVGWYSMSGALLGDESKVTNPLDVTPRNSLTSINRYNSVSGLFEKCDYFDDWGWWPATGSEEFTRLEPGRGYWVMANQDCIWKIVS